MIQPGHVETAGALSLVMLVLLESLSAEQQAVLLLHDVFDFGYAQIAPVVGKSVGNVRPAPRGRVCCCFPTSRT